MAGPAGDRGMTKATTAQATITTYPDPPDGAGEETEGYLDRLGEAGLDYGLETAAGSPMADGVRRWCALPCSDAGGYWPGTGKAHRGAGPAPLEGRTRRRGPARDLQSSRTSADSSWDMPKSRPWAARILSSIAWAMSGLSLR